MNALERKKALAKIPWANAPLQVVLCGFCLTFATPMCCALFPQKASIAVSDLEADLKVCTFNLLLFIITRVEIFNMQQIIDNLNLNVEKSLL